MDQTKQPAKVSIKDVFKLKWLGLRTISFQMNGKTVENYQMVYRPNMQGKNLEVESVDIIPLIKYKNKPTQVVFIANFRPPVMKYVLEFPSGLVENNDLGQNAMRELKEQTGYVIKRILQFPAPKVYMDPWKGNQTSKMVLVEIDGQENQNPQQELENEENIEVILLPLDDNFTTRVLELQEQRGFLIESKLWSVCLGLNLMKFT